MCACELVHTHIYKLCLSLVGNLFGLPFSRFDFYLSIFLLAFWLAFLYFFIFLYRSLIYQWEKK